MVVKKAFQLRDSRGFTIVELMIALSVLATLLVGSSVIMMQIGQLYIKGVNAANLQNSNRNIISDLTSALQFTGNDPYPCNPSPPLPATPTCYNPNEDGGNMQAHSFCIDNTRYSYVLNREQGYDPHGATNQQQTPYVLWRDTMTSANQCPPLDLSPGVTHPQDAFTDASKPAGYDMVPDHMRLTAFSVTENPTGVFSVEVDMSYGDDDLLGPGGTACQQVIGTQFCSTSKIGTTVTRRIQ